MKQFHTHDMKLPTYFHSVTDFFFRLEESCSFNEAVYSALIAVKDGHCSLAERNIGIARYVNYRIIKIIIKVVSLSSVIIRPF